jgi:hypothetical protein
MGPSLWHLAIRFAYYGERIMKMNNVLKWIIIFFGTCVAILAFAVELSAQSHQGFMYAKIYTGENTYTGPIRWGTEEILWTDAFNAAKSTDQYLKLVPDEKNEDSWLNFDWTFSSIWENKVIAHQLACRFGDLAGITMLQDHKAKLLFKNGAELIVNGQGYNDLDSRIHVIDPELGMVSLDWHRISRIDFLPTPSKLETIFGMPLYGTVESVRRENFTGLVIWDNDEHVGADKLDGQSNDGKLSIKFSEIHSIEKKGDGSLVTLHSGREIFLTESNDVNSENRGVVVVTEDLGTVKLSWQAFRKVVFSAAPHTGPSYSEFKKPKILEGTVKQIDDTQLTGRIIYDVDETLDLELLEGAENDIEYHIPFRLISKIIPKNYDYSSVELRTGKTLLLGGMRDISSDNGGLLVFSKGKKDPEYVSWKKIYEIVFK